jgi:hypothetical protein
MSTAKYHTVPAGRFQAIYDHGDGTTGTMPITLFNADWRPMVLSSNGIVPAEHYDNRVRLIRVEAVPR